MQPEYLYLKEYYIDNKFIGYQPFVKKDRDKMGYNGRSYETLDMDVKLQGKNKYIRKGAKCLTILYPMNLGSYELKAHNNNYWKANARQN